VTDAELVDRARGGDRTAFDAIVERYQHAVFRATLAVTSDRSEAEDAAQETFLRAYRRIGDFRGEASLKTWLLAIAWRQAISQRRSLVARMRRLVFQDEPRTPFDPPSRSRSQEDGLVSAEQRSAVAELVKSLPDKYRVALVLAATGDYTFDEMAAALGVPAGTLKWRVAEARRLLKTKLKAAGHLR
jgi:RNA polymerase sigma-70 factor (ECF subfamily)